MNKSLIWWNVLNNTNLGILNTISLLIVEKLGRDCFAEWINSEFTLRPLFLPNDSIKPPIKPCSVYRKKKKKNRLGHGNWAKRAYAEFRQLMEIYYTYKRVCRKQAADAAAAAAVTRRDATRRNFRAARSSFRCVRIYVIPHCWILNNGTGATMILIARRFDTLLFVFSYRGIRCPSLDREMHLLWDCCIVIILFYFLLLLK